ncbi:MAG: DNA repair exonuclease [Candidatus Eisenbacteria bacterium]
MKLLHVSDWHLGCVTRNISRQPDHETVIGEMLAIARQERPDLVLHTGDLFDQARPSYETLRFGIETLQEFATLAPTIVLAGNHDSPALFRLFQRLSGTGSRLRFVDRALPPEAGGILDLPGPNDERIRLAPLPFVHQNRMIEAFEDPSTWMADYADRVQRIEAALGRGLGEGYDTNRDVLLFAAHLHVGGAVFSNSERSIHVTDSYSTRVEHLPPVSYAAFGHIHRPQALPGSLVPGRYAGSPIPLDFGELGRASRSSSWRRGPDDRPRSHRPLSGGRALRRFIGTLDDLAREADTFSDELCSFTIQTASHVPDLSDQVRALCPQAVLLEVIEVCAERTVTALTAADAESEERTGLEPLFRGYLEEMGTQQARADTVLGLFGKLLGDLSHEESVFVPELTRLEKAVSRKKGAAEREPSTESPRRAGAKSRREATGQGAER